MSVSHSYIDLVVTLQGHCLYFGHFYRPYIDFLVILLVNLFFGIANHIGLLFCFSALNPSVRLHTSMVVP